MAPLPLPPTPTLLAISAGAGALVLAGIVGTSALAARRPPREKDALVQPPQDADAPGGRASG